jgi:YbbR domain-containing protein
MRKGLTGVFSLNNELQSVLNPPSKRKREKKFRDIIFRENDKVMQIKNNYNTIWTNTTTHEQGVGVFNGDIGIIKEIEPASITVTLDPAVHKTVPVVVKINGKVGEGLAPDEPQVEPENVEVRGAKSDVDTILEATAEVTLRGDTQDVKKAVTLKGLNAKGEEINDLQFSPNQVSVTIPIIKAGKTKTVGIKVKTEGVPKTGYWVSQTSIEPSMINISGNGEVLANTKFIETQPINVEGIDKNKTYKTE